MIDLSELIHDLDFCTNFIVVKESNPVWNKGELTQKEIKLTVEGIVLPSSSKDIELLPEADRVHGLKSFFTDECEFTLTDTEKTSDICIYRGKAYKLLQVFDYSDNGYYKAIGAMIGDAS